MRRKRPGRWTCGGWRRGLCGGRARGGRDVSAVGVALQALQIGAHVGGVLVAQVAVFFKRLVNYVFQLRGQVWVQADGRNRGTVENRLKNEGGCFSAKWQHPCTHLV